MEDASHAHPNGDHHQLVTNVLQRTSTANGGKESQKTVNHVKIALHSPDLKMKERAVVLMNVKMESQNIMVLA